MKIEKKRVISFLLSFSIMINFFMSLTTIDAHATGTGYVSFKYDNFNNGSMQGLMKENGNAEFAVDGDSTVLRLTPATSGQKGSAYYSNYVSLSNNKSFSTFFSFRMSNAGTSNPDVFAPGADGIVFVINNNTNGLGTEGAGIGYQGITNSIGIEFDTYDNGNYVGDNGLGPSHIAVNKNGDADHPIATAPKSNFGNYDFRQGGIYYAWVDYDGSNQNLQVRINNVNSRAGAYLPIDTNINLGDGSIFNSDNVYVGFTSGTGGAWENNDIRSLYFYNKYQPIDTANSTYTQLPTMVEASNKPSINSSVVTATVTNADGAKPANIPVTFSRDSGNGTLSSTTATTDVNGQVTVTYTDNITENSTIKVTALGGAYATTSITTIGSTILQEGSLGTADDGKITGLTSGNKYEVIANGTTYYVKADGTLSTDQSEERSLTGTEITGLTNGTTYKVIDVTPTAVILSSDSPAGLTADNGKITGLDAEKIYNVEIESGTDTGKYVSEIGNAVNAVVPITGVTEITGLTNGTTYKVTDVTPTAVTLSSDSPAGLTADNGKITGLNAEKIYNVEIESGTDTGKYVSEIGNAVNAVVPITGVTEITGLTNGTTYKVTDVTPTAVTLSSDSPAGLGVGDGKITGLTSGHKYYVTSDGITYYIKADGTLSIDPFEEGSLTGTEITGLTNGVTYKVTDVTPTAVTLSSDSPAGLGVGDGKITGLTSGHKYYVTSDGITYYIKADGTLSTDPSEARSLTGTEIIGLTNGTTYKVTDVTPTAVTLSSDSPAGLTAGDGKITGLTSGHKYDVTSDGITYYVKEDGTLSTDPSEARSLTGTEIIGLTNGKTYTVTDVTPTAVTLSSDSPAGLTAGDGKITGLTSGHKYYVTSDGITYYIKADGTLSIDPFEEGSLTGTEITGLTNGVTYKVTDVTPTAVTLSSDSPAGLTAGDGKITGLTSGHKYYVTSDEITYYVKADGTLSIDPLEEGSLTGTEITGLTNGETYKVIDVTPTAVTLSSDSPAGLTAGDGKITGLTSGHKYDVTSDGITYYVKADGTLSSNQSQAGNLTGTEITGLTNGVTYKVTDVTPTAVTLSSDSPSGLGVGDGKITGLTSGHKYNVTSNGITYYVKEDGTLSRNKSEAGSLTGAEITGLTNGVTYKVTDVTPTAVTLSSDSPLGLGVGDGKITGLTSGHKYNVTSNGITYYVKEDGTLSRNKSEAGSLTGAEITGLTNGATYKVTDVTPTAVTLSSDSPAGLGVGDGKITGLTSGHKYNVTSNGITYYVKEDGTLSRNKSEAGNLTGAEITGLTNGATYKVTDVTPTAVTLSSDSPAGLGVGDGKITGLTSGHKYNVTVNGITYYVKEDGTLSSNKSEAGSLTGAEITGLTNGATYKVIDVTSILPISYILTYTAGEHGTIEGTTSQTITQGDNGTTVTAVADTGYHFLNWSDGNINESRTDTDVTNDLSVSAEFEIDSTNNTDTTTPSAVKIIGTEKVDNTLEAQLIDEDGLSVTTSAAVTYKWYRMPSNDSENGTLVGDGKTYKLVSNDIGKYIKLIASYIDETFEKITAKILGNSSSGSTSSSKHRSSNSSSNSTGSTQQITVKVTDGSSDNSISQTVVQRTTTSDGTKKDVVTYTTDKAKETLAELNSEEKDTARIVATDADTNVSETQVNIPKETLTELSNGNVNLQIETGGAIVSLPKESIQGLAQSGELNEDLYFRLVPIKDETKQKEIKTIADQQATIKAISENSGIQVLGTPMTIETNMSQRNVDIILPLTGINIPTDSAERQAFLNDLGVFIEHSDGEKVFAKGEVVEYKNGILGMKFTVNKFSDFTIVKLNKNNQTGWKQQNGYWYFFNNAGTTITGWYKSESGDWIYNRKDTIGEWFHLGTDGKMDTGWFKDTDGTWYFLCDGKDYGALGYMETGWKLNNGKWYFLKDNGAMATGWTYIDNNWYYLYSDGSMASNTVIDGYTLDASGAWIN
ncbi:lectin-like domain-containing protein [Clostridium saccharobutylicum]|uniref:lectin-like domain-containing protein n=1 Tax=Clostridium saccharobutylicum TaxID=169679 RepID=UPI00156D4A03|nr:hypothetical protein [Clostridium saccharobutylicum]NSC06888.1 hypothetical protein [Clostridium saccharobutylicum]